MAQKKKDLNQQDENLKDDKITEDAQKSLIDDAEKGPLKKTKKEKQKDVKEMTSYQEQALQGATKSRGSKKGLLIVIVLVALLVVVGVGIALFFILRPKDEQQKALVCKVEVLSYYVDLYSDPERYVVVGAGDEFNFTEETQSKSSYTKDLEIAMTEARDISMMYLVNNVADNKYTYTFDFTEIEMSNCDFIVKVNNGSTYTINDSNKFVNVTLEGDIVLEIRISVKNEEIANDTNTWCEGNIDLSLSVA